MLVNGPFTPALQRRREKDLISSIHCLSTLVFEHLAIDRIYLSFTLPSWQKYTIYIQLSSPVQSKALFMNPPICGYLAHCCHCNPYYLCSNSIGIYFCAHHEQYVQRWMITQERALDPRLYNRPVIAGTGVCNNDGIRSNSFITFSFSLNSFFGTSSIR